MKIETIEKAVTTARVQAEVLTKQAQDAGQAARLTKNQAHQAKGKLKQAKQESKRARKAAKVAKRAFAKATSAADKAVAQLSRLEKKIQRLRKKAQKSPRHDVKLKSSSALNPAAPKPSVLKRSVKPTSRSAPSSVPPASGGESSIQVPREGVTE